MPRPSCGRLPTLLAALLLAMLMPAAPAVAQALVVEVDVAANPGRVTVASRAAVTPVAGIVDVPLTIPARTLQVVELRPTGVPAAQLDCILDWGELFYPSLLGPARQPSQSAGDYYFRYYPRTQMYVGTALSQQQLLMLDGRTGAQQMLGPLSSWASTAGCR